MLTLYKKKRDFKNTPEPSSNGKEKTNTHRFVVQRHNASHLHYDFRLQMDGVLKSWAVPKGPSMNPSDKRLAVHVEDHPVSYINFSGIIPKGNYGAGTVEVWDKGAYTPVDEKGNELSDRQALSWLKKGELKFKLEGKKLSGSFVLVQLKKDEKNWLLIKHKDEYAVKKDYNAEKIKKAAVAVTAKKKPGPALKPHLKERASLLKERKLQKYYKPMLATPATDPFDDADWVFEIKWDGYRAIAELGGREIKLYSRNGLSFKNKYPTMAEALGSIEHSMVIDGEIVVLDENNKPSFQRLQQYDEHPEYPILYYVFDLLFLNGKDTRGLSLLERKELLKKALGNKKNGLIRYCDHVKENGIDFFEKAIALDLEGMMAKKADSTYEPGTRTKEWLKIKNHNSREAVIVGFTEARGSRKHFGALVLAERRGKKLTYIGHTGTGFTDKGLKELWTQMQPYITDTSPFKEKIKVNAPVTWLKPVLVCQVKFTEATADGILRHPVYMGLREDKEAKEVEHKNEIAMNTVTKSSKEIKGRRKKEPKSQRVKEKEEVKSRSGKEDKGEGQTEKEKEVKLNGHAVHLTNLTKIYWPKEKITKGQMIDYYDRMAAVILPYLKNRPMSLKRNPNGIADKGFYQKDAGEHFPDWIKTSNVHSESSNKTVHYTLCNDKATLLYLANLGCIEMNPWNSTIAAPDKPTYLIIDIDPSEKNSFDQVIETAQVVRDILEKAGAPSYCKTSGATGLHVYVPLNAKYDYEHARKFGEIIATLTQQQLPAFTSIERNLQKRGNKIYVDYLQNSRGQTIASAYSVRPMPGAQVSAPLSWKEVKPGLQPSQFTIFNIEKRVKDLGDLFYMALKKGVNINECLKKIAR